MWNAYLNADIPNPQSDSQQVVCANMQNCTVDQGLATTIAQFKTPTLRDLEDSAPYFHHGSKAKFDEVVNFYIRASQSMRAGTLRNGDVQLGAISLSAGDLDALGGVSQGVDGRLRRRLMRKERL